MKNWQKIIKWLESEAQEQGISQIEIGKRTGIEQPHISRFFRGEVCPRLDTFLSISKAIGISITPRLLAMMHNYLKKRKEKD